MSLLYRAMWETKVYDPNELLKRYRTTFDKWAYNPREDMERDVREESVFSGFENALEYETTDIDPAGQEWRVFARFRVVDDVLHALVENYSEGPNVAAKIAVGRPRVVSDLLALSRESRLGKSKLIDGVTKISSEKVENLVTELRDTDRRVPYIVFTEPKDAYEARIDWERLAADVAARSAGVANVYTLDRAATFKYMDVLGDLATWNGGVRTYGPGNVEENIYSHRYYTWRHLNESHPWKSRDRLVFGVTSLSTRLKPFDTLIGPDWEPPTLRNLEESKQELESTIAAKDQTISQLKDTLDMSELELAEARAHLERIKNALIDVGRPDLFWGTSQPELDELPMSVFSLTDAVQLAQEHLSEELSVPFEALREEEKLDTHECGPRWANTVWHGLKNLAEFVRDKRTGFKGDFWVWCKQGSPNRWQATAKRLAMKESDTVLQMPRLREARMLPVDTALNGTGKLLMEPHLKIAPQVGTLSPRVYFYDDTSGVTGKVHVGFIGPHSLMPNSKS
ncbi:hypothetical protein ABYF32_04355 [Buchananella felis]|uniref:hypothetical protein n=1 Tax=Buchananella felis TaxID=3231492 RepID=UPI003527D782